MFLFLAFIWIFVNRIESSSQNWNQLVHSFSKYQFKHIENDIEFAQNITNSSKISWNCRKSLSQTLNALKGSELFAYQMYDSWPTFPPQAILEGTVNSFGDYDQCMAIGPNQIIGSSQYCLITFKVPLPQPKSVHINVNHKVENLLPDHLVGNESSDHFFTKLAENAIFFHIMPLKIGLCLPNKCDANDVQNMVQKGSHFYSILFSILIFYFKAFENSGLLLVRTDCNTTTESHLNRTQIMALSVICSRSIQ